MLSFLTGFNFDDLENLNVEITVIGLNDAKQVVLKQRIKLYGKDMIMDFIKQSLSKNWAGLILSIEPSLPVESVKHLEFADIKLSVSK